MKAKGTVMNDATKRQFRYIPNKPSEDISQWDIDGALELQAEITAPIFFEEGHKAGIREVVEWIEQYSHASMRDIFGDDWRAKLKELGIE